MKANVIVRAIYVERAYTVWIVQRKYKKMRIMNANNVRSCDLLYDY